MIGDEEKRKMVAKRNESVASLKMMSKTTVAALWFPLTTLLAITLRSTRPAAGLACTVGHQLYPRRVGRRLRGTSAGRRSSATVLCRWIVSLTQFGVLADFQLRPVVEGFLRDH
jgi:hypothetical protein